LTLTPLLTAVKWAWASYEQGRALLEQSQETQVRLQETLKDLADANVQLVRLNRQAQALRQVAEDERRIKEQFVANVSHEMRTPLNMIVGFCEMITKTPESYGDDVPPALLADLEVVLRNSQHLSNLIDDVLDLSQLEAGQMALTKERVALSELVEAVTIAVRPLFESKGLYLETEMSDDLPLIFCDRTRIREVLLNLLSNAGRFTEKGGVRLWAWREGRHVTVSVQDTGPGIPDKDRARLFRPFQQADGSVRRRYGGTGLGLSISKSFVELHGGRMWLESAVSAGTAFFFTLPIDPLAPLEDSPTRWITPGWEFLQRTCPVRMPSPMVRPRLGVVEEGNALQRLLGRYLTDVEIAPLSDLETARAELSRVPTQALLINAAHLGDVPHWLEEANGLPRDVPLLVCTIPGIEQAVNGLGVADYLVKPISQQALLEALERLEHEVKTVLVVDDEPDTLRLFRRMLVAADRGYRVVRAASGQQALDVLRQEAVDVILLDLVMPEMDGFQLLALKDQDENLRDIPVILISAQDPMGQPIVSNVLAVTRKQGLSTRELIAGIQALGTILSPMALYEAKSRQTSSEVAS
jgi:signal transduction histidine kinase/CheY-like chemotaxis protein